MEDLLGYGDWADADPIEGDDDGDDGIHGSMVGEFTRHMNRLYGGYVEQLLRFLQAHPLEEREARDAFWQETEGDFIVSQDVVFLAMALKEMPDTLDFHPSRRLIDALYYATEVFLFEGLFMYFKRHLERCLRCGGYWALISGEADTYLFSGDNDQFRLPDRT